MRIIFLSVAQQVRLATAAESWMEVSRLGAASHFGGLHQESSILSVLTDFLKLVSLVVSILKSRERKNLQLERDLPIN